MTGFRELGVGEERVAVLRRMGITAPTPIQEKAIPPVMAGQDVIGQAQTGTGKTMAFVLPMLEKLDPASPYVQGLIVSPTRELALQITAEVKKLTAGQDDLRVLAVYGGQDVEAQLHKLKREVQLIVCTPGRLLDHMRRGTIELSHVKMLVLDEADQMLHMGFLGEVEQILRAVPYKRQTLLFSATIPGTVRELAERILKDPVQVTVKGQQVTVKDIRQLVIETTDRAKQAALLRMIDEQNPFLAMIFCRTKRRASALNEALQSAGYNSDELHGDLSQAKRERVMKRFREAKLQLLVATDVAARGLDVEGVTHVFNYDIPQDVDSYIHRIGRTGRAGAEGLAVTFAAPKDMPELAAIEYGIGQVLERRSFTSGRSASKASAEPGEGRKRVGGGEKESRGRAARFGGRGAANQNAGRGAANRFTGKEAKAGRGRDSGRGQAKPSGNRSNQQGKPSRGKPPARSGRGRSR